jgi:ethanolamine kinase
MPPLHAELESLLSRHPLLYCHGDLNPANMIFDPVRRSVIFIDLEFAGPNFQAFEIAQHFMTFVCGDLSKVGRDEFVPAREFQLRWCHAYLTGFMALPREKVCDGCHGT